MDLSVNPYTIINRPTFGSKKENKDIADQWKLWRKQTRQVRDIFSKLKNKRKSMGPDSTEFQSFLGTLSLSSDFIQKNLRTDMNLTAAVEGHVIVEAARRFLHWCKDEDFYNISSDGHLLPWERDIE